MSNSSKSKWAKSLLYVDEYKMHSLSSQLLGGVISSISNTWSVGEEKHEEQKGPMISGKTMSDATAKQSETIERRVLFDYAYTKFEQELEKRGKLIVISPDSSLPTATATIVKVTGKTCFTDVLAISKFVAEMNKITEVSSYLSSHDARMSGIGQLKAQLSNSKNRNEIFQITQKIAELSDPKQVAKKMGTQQDDKLLDSLKYFLQSFYGDHFELRVSQAERKPAAVFTSILNRQYLRDLDSLVIKKFSRYAQAQFTVVGLVTQIGDDEVTDESPQAQDNHDNDTRTAILDRFSHLVHTMEKQALGVKKNEFFIDPIAVYQELVLT